MCGQVILKNEWPVQEPATEEMLSERPAGIMPAQVPSAGDGIARLGRRQHSNTQSSLPDPHLDLFVPYLPHLKITCECSGLRREFIVWFIKAGFLSVTNIDSNLLLLSRGSPSLEGE